MKFAFKSLVAAAAFVAVGAASAATGYDWTVVGGSGSLTFSTDALSALSASGSSILTATPIGTGLPGAGSANSAAYTKASGNVALTFSSATVSGDNLTSLTAANSLVDIRRSVFNDDGSVSQFNVYLANFKVDLSSATIFADLYTNTGAGSTLVSKGNLAIYTATGVSGGNITVSGVSNGVASGAATGSLTGPLKFNSATADVVLVGLGLDTTGPVADLVKNSNWGATTASGTFTAPAAAVPEPSSYALLGAGLLAIGAMARRRKSA